MGKSKGPTSPSHVLSLFDIHHSTTSHLVWISRRQSNGLGGVVPQLQPRVLGSEVLPGRGCCNLLKVQAPCVSRKLAMAGGTKEVAVPLHRILAEVAHFLFTGRAFHVVAAFFFYKFRLAPGAFPEERLAQFFFYLFSPPSPRPYPTGCKARAFGLVPCSSCSSDGCSPDSCSPAPCRHHCPLQPRRGRRDKTQNCRGQRLLPHRPALSDIFF